jgi:hypothetical protein
MQWLNDFLAQARHWVSRRSTGRTLVLIVIIKLVIMFLVLKLIFFPDILQTRFSTDQERSNHVLDQITNRK